MPTDAPKIDAPGTPEPSAARYLLVLALASAPLLVYGVLSLAARITSAVPALLNLAAYGAGKAAQKLTVLALGRKYATSQVPPLRQPPPNP